MAASGCAKRVAVGGTFACDDALAVPLQHLLDNAVWNASVEVQWLRYGSLAHLNEWTEELQPVDLVLLLVRLSDLEAAHPELQTISQGSVDTNTTNANVRGPLEQFLRGLEYYDADDQRFSAPLVVLLCPSPPAAVGHVEELQTLVQQRVGTMRKVQLQPSEQLVELFQQQYPSAESYDPVADKRQHSPYTQTMLNTLSLSLCRQICRLFRTASNRKKVIALDCDNTLWGGAVAELGPHGIDLAPRFVALQRFVVAQQQRGLLLVLCSKNILQDVVQVFRQRGQDLPLDLNKHVVAIKANWQPKSQSLMQLAKELSLGLDSFVFIDDNPLECSEVAAALPAVTVLNLPAEFSTSYLEQEWVFDEGFEAQSGGAPPTKEDSARTTLYRQNRDRQMLQEASTTYSAFLSALGVKIEFEELGGDKERVARSPSFTRALQLHHRTNQFNMSTTFAKQLDEQEFLRYTTSRHHTVLCAHVTDRFGHYGLVSVALCRAVENTRVLRVDSFLLSCRALNRGVEHAMMRKLSGIAGRFNASTLELAWEPTERNEPAHLFFSMLSSVDFVANGDDAAEVAGRKKSRSATAAGVWLVPAHKASQVSFLKAGGGSQSVNPEKRGFLPKVLALLFNPWLRDATVLSIKWIFTSFTPQWALAWLPSWLQALFDNRPVGNQTSGLLRVPFHRPGSLAEFINPVLPATADETVLGIAVGTDDGSSNEDHKFRRKARHRSKMVLVSHLHDETPQVIWSANRLHSDGKHACSVQSSEEDPTKHENDHTANLQRACQTPQCSSVVQRDSRCAFHMCRNCCYRVQRLLTRSQYHSNTEARRSAEDALRVDFAIIAAQVTADQERVSETATLWCNAHQNKRRRGEIFNS